VAENHYDVPTDNLPLSFNYAHYIREKTIWQCPLTWTAVKPSHLPSGRSRSGVARLGNKVVVVGGHTRQQVGGDFIRENDIWSFDTETETYSEVKPVLGKGPPRISRLCLESFGDVIYSFGGILQDKTKINSIYSFELANKEWTEIKTKGTPPSPRCDPFTCAYNSASRRGIIVFGGSQEGLVYHSDIHFFNVDTHTWEEVVIENEGPSSRIGATAAVIGDKMYLFGGAVWNIIAAKYTKNFNEMWCLHLGDGAWRWELLPNAGTPPTGTLVNLTTIPIGNHLLIEGIMNYPISFVYDTVTYSWTTLCASGRSVNTSNFSSAVLVGDAIYYVCGYRNHMLAQDVVKLPISHILKYIREGTVPEVLREKKRLACLDEMDICSDQETATGTAALDQTASSGSDSEEEEEEGEEDEEEDEDESMEQGEEIAVHY